MMEQYKTDFIKFLLETGALKVGGDYTLKSGRISPWFVNVGDFNDGESSAKLGGFYADSIMNSGAECDTVYGIPEKGSALCVATAIEMARKGKNVPWFFTRKDPKGYGEYSNLSPAERSKALVVGRVPKDGQNVVQLDDVFTAGDAKYEARQVLELLGNLKMPLLAIAVDRQEVDVSGSSAIQEYESKTGTRVVSVVNAIDVYSYLKEGKDLPEIAGKKEELIKKREQLKDSVADLSDLDLEIERLSVMEAVFSSRPLERLSNYLRVYGAEAARSSFPALEQVIIGRDRSVIPACDIDDIDKLRAVVRATAGNEKIGGYKFGFELGLTYGLGAAVAVAREFTDKPIIYDHQKAGTDIPDTGKNFAKTCKKAGVDAVIFFPQAGPETERAWIYHALDQGLNVIVGGRMTHKGYAVSEGGFITDEGAKEMYRIAARAGVKHFVVPGNKPEVITEIRGVIEGEGLADYSLYSPGFIAQGGNLTKAAEVAGNKYHAIVGRAIMNAADPAVAAAEMTSKL